MARRRRLAERRKAVGLSQEGLAELIGVDRSTVVRWERGDTQPQPWHRPNLARALGVSIEDLAAILTDTGRPPLPPGVERHGLGQHAVEDDLAVARSLRVAERQMGGGYLYPAVTSYLQRTVAPRLFGIDAYADEQDVFASAAALTEMAGWMAHDAGRSPRAEQHLKRALRLSQVGQDSQLGAHILASLSHLAHHARRPEQAINHARQGHERLAAGGHPVVRALLLAMEARGHAALRDRDSCHAALNAAESALATDPNHELSPWVTPFDEASMATEAARCFHEFGQFGAAQRQLERVVEVRPPDRARSRAFAQLMLVPILLAKGRPDEACFVAHQVLDETRSLSSYLVVQQICQLTGLLAPYRRNTDTVALLDRLREELRERRWLSEWLRASDDSVAS